MSEPDNAGRARLRWLVYAILIAIAVGQMSGRILAVNAVETVRLERYRIDQRLQEDRARWTAEGMEGDELQQRLDDRRDELQRKLRLQRPFLSANDRSRWLAVRALVERGDFEIESFFEEPTWDTIDMVQHRGRDGERHLYSSKPPLLMVLFAAPYWLIHQTTGATLGSHPYEIGRGLMFLFSVAPFAWMIAVVAGLVERHGRGDFGRVLAVATIAMATQLSAFAIVLNNHLFGALGAVIAIDAWSRIRTGAGDRPVWYAVAGFAAAFAATSELPAFSLLALLGLVLVWRNPGATLKWGAPAALFVLAAFFATNYWAHESLRPPYMHRSETDANDNWYDYSYTVGGVERDSYWRNRQGIDVGEESIAVYALHALIGHHGVFSLTPIWLLSFYGGWRWMRDSEPARREFALIVLSLSVICLVFYIGLRPQDDRNYGGMTNGFRWMFWFAPLWAVLLAPAVEGIRSRAAIAVVLTLLAMSALSASYPTWNPWTHPWIHNWMEHLGFDPLG